MSRKVAYYPGCSLHSTSKEYDQSVRAVCGRIGVELEELEDWVCCGATPVHAVKPKLALALGAKNLGIAARTGRDVMVPCAACFNRMKTAAKHLEDAGMREKMNALAETDYPGGTHVEHVLTVLRDAEEVAVAVTKKLEGLKVACYYGCLILRPPKLMEVDDPENPTIMERLAEAAGAEPVAWNFRTECCGAAHSMPRTDVVLRLTNDILGDAKARGADIVVTACPLCHVNLDMRQQEMERKFSKSYHLPVLYVTQLLGLAMGLTPAELGLGKHLVPAEPVLKEKNLI